MLDLFREIFQSLSNNRTRTALTGLAVAWGIFMLIVLLGMSRGVSNSFNSHVTVDNARSMNVYNGFTSKPYKGYREGRMISVEDNDTRKIQQENRSHVEEVTASKQLDSSMVSTPKGYVNDDVWGKFPSELGKARLKMIQGRFLSQKDLDELRRVIVISEPNSEILFGKSNDAVGQRVKIMGLSWLVVGVYRHDWEKSSYIPYTTAMLLSGNNDKVSDLSVKIDHVSSLEDGQAVEKAVRGTLARSHDFDPEDDSAIHIWNRFTNYLQQKTAMDIMDMAVWLIGIFTLLSGIVGVSNIMFVSVRERRHEIGIRRAIGAKPKSVLLQIVAESGVITTLFGYIGVVLGMIVTGVIDMLSKGVEFLDNPTVDLSIAIKVTIVLIVAGAFAGLFPAIKATKVKPVEALRDE